MGNTTASSGASAAAKRNNRADHAKGHVGPYKKARAALLRQGGVCGICGKPVDVSIKDHLNPMAPVVDHIIPISKGGHPSDISNMQLAHRWCNRQKSDKLVDYSIKFQELSNEVKNDDLPQHYDWKNYIAK